ncbi:MAG: U32 family peptidase [Clostridia bacterium]|nr:U32 family peptidase [Clostridia bacterium]
MNNVELLAPVGSYDALVACVQSGADAVYLSGGRFGARQFAKNFNDEELIEAIHYAHIRGVNVYVTVNTLIKDHEWDDVTSYVDFLYVNQVDGIIVQDLGLSQYIRKQYPDLELHASTQMSAHNLDDVVFLKKIGFNRVVVAREMPIEEIEMILKAVDIEIEVFVHGALCVSYSGQCLMSSFIGGRSGNRGRCAQPCRQIYEINGKKDYTISPKDLNVLSDLQKLIDIGVKSLKIEGRMKGPEYAATVVSAYRNQMDGHLQENHLKQIFNRTYTRGFLMVDKQIIASDAPGNRGEYIGKVHAYNAKDQKLSIDLDKPLHKGDEIQIRRKNDSVGARTDVFYEHNQRVTQVKGNRVEVPFKYTAEPGEKIYRTYDAKWMQESKQIYEKDPKRILVKGYIQMMEGQSPFMTLSDGVHEVSKIGEMPCEKAEKVPLSREKVEQQISKMGQTAYQLGKLEIDMENQLALPMKVLNDLRRQCTDALDALRREKYQRESHYQVVERFEMKSVKPKLAVTVHTKEQYDAVKDMDVIIYNAGERISDEMPIFSRIKTTDEMAKLKANYNKQMPCVVGNLGCYDYFETCITDFSLNIMNSKSSDFIRGRATLSYELNYKEINSFQTKTPLELIVYGRVPLMIMAYCPITKQNVHCETCKQPCSDHPVIKDRFENMFPMIRTGNRLEILSHEPMHLMPHLKNLKPIVSVYRLNFTIESGEDVQRITKDYLNYMHEGQISYYDHTTAYHFLNGVE